MTQVGKLPMKRRDFVRASVAGAAALVGAKVLPASAAEPAATSTTVGAVAQIPPPYVGAGSNAPVRPFLLQDVSLGTGLLQEKRDRMKNFLRLYDERRFLVLFNNQAGRPNPPGVAVPGGWEDGGLLSGHYAGHFLTALAQCYADAGEQVFKDKLDWTVDELAACQEAITARIGGGGGGDPEPEEPPIDRVAGRFGNALRLNGPSNAQYVNLPQEAISQLTDFSIAGWVNLASTQSWTRLFDFGQNTTVNMVPDPTCRRHRYPTALCHHRRRLRPGAADHGQRGAASRPVDTPCRHARGVHRHALRERSAGGHELGHDAQPVEPG